MLTQARLVVTLDGMGVGVLGPLTVDGDDVGLGPRDRVVLAALAVRPGETVSADRLADALWGEALPTTWPKVVQGASFVSGRRWDPTPWRPPGRATG